ncbi:hypothetical protein RSK60_520013 [Ralstonia solanacearum K60]|nr:hypothetical protein RSK60_520013 [Ralstonia solanacearum K60]
MRSLTCLRLDTVAGSPYAVFFDSESPHGRMAADVGRTLNGPSTACRTFASALFRGLL